VSDPRLPPEVDLWTRVEFNIYLPSGWTQTFFVKTGNRWKAVCRAAAEVGPMELEYLNYVSARLCSAPTDDVLVENRAKVLELEDAK